MSKCSFLNVAMKGMHNCCLPLVLTPQDERHALESEAGSLVEYASRLQAQSAELAASHAELEEAKVSEVNGKRKRSRGGCEVTLVVEQLLQKVPFCVCLQGSGMQLQATTA
jgi:hypothetical protein